MSLARYLSPLKIDLFSSIKPMVYGFYLFVFSTLLTPFAQSSECVLALLQDVLSSYDSGAPDSLAIDAIFVRQMENQYNQIDRAAITGTTGPAYRRLQQQLLRAEYRRYSPRVRQLVDAIRREGKIPLFRVIIGDWVDPSQQAPYGDYTESDAMRNSLRSQGRSHPEVWRVLRSRFRPEGVSTSLSLTAGIDAALSTRTFGGNGKLQVVILAWDGRSGQVASRSGFYGTDPMEIYLDPLAVGTREVIDATPQFAQNVDNHLNGNSLVGRRGATWPFILNHLGQISEHP